MKIVSGYWVQKLDEHNAWVPVGEATTSIDSAVEQADTIHAQGTPSRVVDGLSELGVYVPGFEPAPLTTVQFDKHTIEALSAAIDVAVKYGNLDEETVASLESVLEVLR